MPVNSNMCVAGLSTFSLSRNTRLVVSTVKVGGTFDGTPPGINSWEVPILDGYSFSQDNTTTEIQVNEAGCTPIRGQKQFNTAVNPAQFSFTTYVRPYRDTTVFALENILWAALMNANTELATIDEHGNVPISATSTVADQLLDFESSDTNDLLKLQLYFDLDGTFYHIEDALLDTGSISFDIEGIAQIVWGGQGTAINSIAIADTPFDGDNFLAANAAVQSTNSAEFIRNKVSLVTLNDFTPAGIKVGYTAAMALSDVVTMTPGVFTTIVTIDGVAAPISITTVATTTVEDIIAGINTDLDATNAVAELSIDGKSIMIYTIDRKDLTTPSSVVIDETAVGDTLFDSIATATPSVYAAANTDMNNTAVGDVTAVVVTVNLDNTNGTNYNVALTGGTLDISNNITFLTPDALGVVNTSIGGFAGTRTISGTLSAYLKSGNSETGGLLQDLLDSKDQTVNCYYLEIDIGGCDLSGPRLVLVVPFANIVLPTINVQDILSTDINFTGLGSDLSQANELYVRYHATP